MTLTAVHPADLQQQRIWLVARVLVVIVTLLLLALLGRVVQLQFRPEPQIADRISNRGTQTSIMPRRGAILDAKGRPLAVSSLGYKLYADPVEIGDKNLPTFAAHVGHAIGVDPAAIDQLISQKLDKREQFNAKTAASSDDEPSPLRYVVLNPLLSDEQYSKIQALKLPGVGLEPRLIRHYPQGQVAGQIVGFVGVDHKGLDGLEFALDHVLNGKPGALSTLRDARRRPLWVEEGDYQPSQDGHDIQLSIDSVVQAIAETELNSVCKAHRARAGEIIVLDSRNGQILALANWPAFDPAASDRSNEILRRNRCVVDPIEPGSIFKPFLHAAATSMGLARPATIVDTGSGLWATPYGRKLRDAHAHGSISWEQVLIVSSNIGMAKVCEPMGAKKMYDAVRAFGFGQRTGADLPGESPGILNDLKKWNKYSLSSIPMGQEISVTPLQMVKGFSAFANGGLVVSPSIIAAEAQRPIFQRAVDAKTAEATRYLLRRVVIEGTGRRADSKLYQIWGKTGTAQIPDRVTKTYKARAFNASFIGGAPLRDPRIICIVTVNEPDPSVAYYGGVVSAPAAKNVIEQTLTYLGVAPDNDSNPASSGDSPHANFRD